MSQICSVALSPVFAGEETGNLTVANEGNEERALSAPNSGRNQTLHPARGLSVRSDIRNAPPPQLNSHAPLAFQVAAGRNARLSRLPVRATFSRPSLEHRTGKSCEPAGWKALPYAGVQRH
jgi:hypothetical protein